MELKTIKEFCHKNNLGEGLEYKNGKFQVNIDNELNTIATALTDLNENKANKDDLSTLYKVKGSSTVADINVMTPEVGWVYNLTDSGTIINGLTGEVPVDAGDNVVYTDSGWDKLSAATKIALEAGENISIEGNIISALGYTYNAEKDSFSTGSGSATGDYSHAEGFATTASGYASHAEGEGTIASGERSHAEGGATKAEGIYSHAEGDWTIASGFTSHAEGSYTVASGDYSHAEGFHTITNNTSEHSQGIYNISNNGITPDKQTIHSIGIGTSDTDRKNAFEVMQNGDAYLIGVGDYKGTNPAEALTLQETVNSKVDKEEGKGLSINDYTTEEKNKLEGIEEGALVNTVVSVNGQVGEVVISELTAGTNIDITDNIISALGYTYNKEKNSFSIGNGTTASGKMSYAEGYKTIASGGGSHAEGFGTTASEYYAHAEGCDTTASGTYSHSEGWDTVAYGTCSHSEGSSTTASSLASHAEGAFTTTNTYCEHAQGLYNVSNEDSVSFGSAGNTIHSIGIGTSEETRKNAQEVMQNGDHYIIGIGNYDGTNIKAEGVKTLQEVLEDISDGSNYTAGDNISIENGTISTLGYEFDNELNSVKVGRKLTVEELEEIFGESAATLAAGDTSILTAWENGTFSWAKDTNIIQVTDTSVSLPGIIFKVTTNDDSILCCIVDRDLPNNQLIVDKDIPFDYIENVSTLDMVIGIAYGKASIAGQATVASGNMAHSEGFDTFAHGMSSHSEGIMNWSLGAGSHVEGIGSVAYELGSHAEGFMTKASGYASHAEGGATNAEGIYSHAEGHGTTTNNDYEHAQGRWNVSNTTDWAGDTIHSIGIGTSDEDRKNALEVTTQGAVYMTGVGGYEGTTLAECYPVLLVINALLDSKNNDIPAINQRIDNLNIPTLPENIVNTINGQTGDITLNIPSIEGLVNSDTLQQEISILNQKIDNLNIPTLPQNIVNTINGQTGDVVLPDTSTLATKEEVQAVNTRIDELNIPSDLSNVVTKTDNYQVTLGTDNNATHEKTLLVGTGLATSNNESLVVGAYNNAEYFASWGVDAPAIQVGAGTEDSKRTVMVVQKNGKSLGLLGFEQNGFGDFAEYFEWADGNPEGEDRVGYMVLLNEDKIEFAESLDNCIGIITGTGAFVADSACLDWHGRYLKDKWGRNIYELTGVLAENPDYDPTKEYIPREYRKEWSPVGLVGKILVRQDGTLKPNGFVGCVNGIATNVDKSSWRVLKVINEEIALILIR